MEEDTITSPVARPPSARAPSHGAAQRPRGILKNPSHDGRLDAPNLTWDEENLQINEENKDSKMKITEPKTPYVRYDAESDMVMDLDKIPGFELGAAEPYAYSSSGSAPSSRHGSFTSSRSGSQPGSRRGSDSAEKKVDIVLDENAIAGGLPLDDDEDESTWDEETRAKHKEFKNNRKSHYRNEAQAMKQAKALLAAGSDEEAIEDEEVDDPRLATIAEQNRTSPIKLTNGNGR